MRKKSKSVLVELKFEKSYNKTVRDFEKYIAKDFRKIEEKTPHEYVKYCYEKYKEGSKAANSSINGRIFELIIETCLFREKLTPMFLQANVSFVPNVLFDIILYSNEQIPIALSLKTSARERYKQADLEAVALKYVHRRALNYLILLNPEETKSLKEKLSRGDLLGLNNIISADTEEFDDLINALKEKTFICPDKIEIITGNIIE